MWCMNTHLQYGCQPLFAAQRPYLGPCRDQRETRRRYFWYSERCDLQAERWVRSPASGVGKQLAGGSVSQDMADKIRVLFNLKHSNLANLYGLYFTSQAYLPVLVTERLVHGHITSHNVLVVETDSTVIAKVTDTGLPALLQVTPQEYAERCPRARVYLPPEALAGDACLPLSCRRRVCFWSSRPRK